MGESLVDRKQKHLDVCLDESDPVESGRTGLAEIGLPHRSLPETHADRIDLSTEFLGYRLKLPVMISCMTGGSEDGRRLNRLLAQAAEETGLAIGTGSIRVMLRHPDTKSHFDLKSRAPNVPVLANIGAAQLVEYPPERILEAVRSIEADGLYVHLNPAQELFQDGGDRDFTGWYDGFRRLVDAADIPILAKETGAGIPPAEGLRLLDIGVDYVDVAGSGGTDWVAVESRREAGAPRESAESFLGWGYSTGTLLLAYRQIGRTGGERGRLVQDRIIASGGLRSPRDFAVCLACGAYLTASALPFIRRAAAGGMPAVHDYVQALEIGLKAAVVLTGSGDLADLRNTALRIPSGLAGEADALAEEAFNDMEVNS